MYLTKKMKKTVAFTAFVITIIILYYILQMDNLTSESYINIWTRSDNISCHYINAGDALPSAEDQSFSPTSDSLFFHETSCRGGLNSRQACAVESAARAHPHWQIYVLFNGPISDFTLKKSCLAKLQQFTNVKFARVHILEYAKGTPLEAMIASGSFNESKYHVEHIADALRFLTLYKWGGVYLDTDMLVVKPLKSLGTNWAAREDDSLVNIAAMAFSKDQVGSELVEAVLKEIETSYRPDLWIHNGPGALNRVLEKTCSTSEKVNWSASTCGGFQIYDPELIYPIHYNNKELYFEPGELENVAKAHTHHTWNKLTYNMNVTKGSPYEKLAIKYCPKVYEFYGDKFGS